MISFTLPYPPSVNHYWKPFRGRMVIGKAGREYRTAALLEICAQNVPRESLSGRLKVEMVIYNPDNEMRRNEIRDDHLARLVWNAAMDKAKAKCIQVSERYMETDFHKYAELQSNAIVGASDCADAIDELKEPQT